MIAKTRGSAGTLGLHRPTIFSVNADGVPLGLPRIAFDAPDGQADKKTQHWLRGWRDISRLTAGLANTRVTAVMDRESDAIDLFCTWHDESGADLLVRATHDRGLAEETTLFETMRAASAYGSIVPRRGGQRGAKRLSPGARRVRRSAPGAGRRSTCRSRNAGARS